MEHLIRARELSKIIAGKELFNEVNFEVNPYDCIGFIGPNGSGKTTLFKMILGEELPTLGELRLNEGLRIRYLEQTAVRDKDISVQQFFEQITSPEGVNRELKMLEARLADPDIYETGSMNKSWRRSRTSASSRGKAREYPTERRRPRSSRRSGWRRYRRK